VATTSEHLFTAIRFLMVQHRLAVLAQSRPEVDTSVLEAQVQRVRTSLGRVATINRKLSDLRLCANDIQTEAEDLRNDIRSALIVIEDAVHAVLALEAVAACA
jgi:hypothetical protein